MGAAALRRVFRCTFTFRGAGVLATAVSRGSGVTLSGSYSRAHCVFERRNRCNSLPSARARSSAHVSHPPACALLYYFGLVRKVRARRYMCVRACASALVHECMRVHACACLPACMRALEWGRECMRPSRSPIHVNAHARAKRTLGEFFVLRRVDDDSRAVLCAPVVPLRRKRLPPARTHRCTRHAHATRHLRTRVRPHAGVAQK